MGVWAPLCMFCFQQSHEQPGWSQPSVAARPCSRGLSAGPVLGSASDRSAPLQSLARVGRKIKENESVYEK